MLVTQHSLPPTHPKEYCLLNPFHLLWSYRSRVAHIHQAVVKPLSSPVSPQEAFDALGPIPWLTSVIQVITRALQNLPSGSRLL